MRPTRDSDLYKDMQYSLALKQTKKIKKKIAVVARERWFLLNLKAKFADGQYLASRLSKSITKASSKIKSLLSQLNSLNIESSTWFDAINLSNVWYEAILESDTTPIPQSVKLQAI